MVLQKLENFRNKDIVKEEAEILTDLLDDITKNLVCPETFEKISQLKDLSKTKNYRDLNQLVEQLSNEEMTLVISFVTFNFLSRIISVCIMISILQRRLLYHLFSLINPALTSRC